MESNDQSGEQIKISRCPFLALSILFFFAAFFPSDALAAGTYLKDKAPEFIDKTRATYGAMVDNVALENNADPKLVLAVIVVESEGNERVVSRRGAQGLMQLMPKTARAMGAKNLKEPLQNIIAGTKYLKELEGDDDFNSLQEVLVAYNMGPNAAKHWLLRHTPEEYAYVTNVMYIYHILEEKTLEEDLVAKNAEQKLSNQELLARLEPAIASTRALALKTFPMTIPSSRRNEIAFAN